MGEDSKAEPSSQAQTAEETKKPQPAPAPVAAQPRPQASAPPAPAARPPAPPPRPAAVSTPPPSRPKPPANEGRRNFVKAMVTIGAVLSMIPFVPWGSYLSSTLSGTGSDARQKVVVDDLSTFGAAAGQTVNVNDMDTFPPDTGWLITYPSSGNLTTDTENPDTFVKWRLIRLPAGTMGGDQANAAAFVAFSEVCVHLWCSPSFVPTAPTEHAYQCPCHGSQYEIPDGLATLGPASLQPAPTNAIPMLTLFADSSGDLWIETPIWDVDHNGIIGYGRNYDSYYSYIKGYTPANPPSS